MEVDFVYGLQILGAALTFKGDYQVAIETLQWALTLKEGDRPIIIAELGHTYAKAGKMAEAGEQLRRLLKLQDQGRFVDAYYLAWVYAGLGEMVEAQRSLEKAVREQSTWIFNINVNPRLIPLHNETTFHDLLKRMNLE
jgi:tetratricopeptide (TPR) repeat protein